MVFNNKKKAAQGIGTLIIFIALILVAAVAAGVLIQTASNLQSKALDVGAQSQQRVTTALEVVSVEGINIGTTITSYNTLNTTEHLEMVVRLASGSSPIKLDDLEIKQSTQTSSGIMSFNTTVNSTSINSGTSTRGFGANLGKEYIEVGDTVTLIFNFVNNINESEPIRIQLLPKDGTPIPIDVTTPNVMTTKIITLR